MFKADKFTMLLFVSITVAMRPSEVYSLIILFYGVILEFIIFHSWRLDVGGDARSYYKFAPRLAIPNFVLIIKNCNETQTIVKYIPYHILRKYFITIVNIPNC